MLVRTSPVAEDQTLIFLVLFVRIELAAGESGCAHKFLEKEKNSNGPWRLCNTRLGNYCTA